MRPFTVHYIVPLNPHTLSKTKKEVHGGIQLLFSFHILETCSYALALCAVHFQLLHFYYLSNAILF